MRTFDLAIVGGGPAGLTGAIMASSEGLKTVLVERDHLGGQSCYSPKIENVPGFPDGITGPELAAVSERQARKFGTEFIVGAAAEEITLSKGGTKLVSLSGGETLAARSVLVAMGMQFRNLPVPGGDQTEPRGICFDTCEVAGNRWAGKTVYVVGAANSAGQAALFLADRCEKVNLIARGIDIATGMSQYLVARILSHPKIEVLTKTTVTAYYPHEAIILDREGRPEFHRDCDGLFVFIGSEPAACICSNLDCDETGFIKADPFSLESNLPGVFVAGDIRAGSVKRVATAYGDAVRAVAHVHQYLAGNMPRKVAA